MSGPPPPPPEASGEPPAGPAGRRPRGRRHRRARSPPRRAAVPRPFPAARPNSNLPALAGEARLDAPVVRTGLFGVQDTPDTSGYGRLRVHRAPLIDSPRPYGSYFDAVADALGDALGQAGIGFSDAIEHVIADRGELTFYVRRERLPEVAATVSRRPRAPLRDMRRGFRRALPG